MKRNRKKILIVDDHELVRRGLCSLIETCADWVVCGEAANGAEAVEKALELRPDVVIMDLTMHDGNGLEAARSITGSLPETNVVVLTMHKSEEFVQEVINSGARAYVLKSDAGQELVNAIEAVLRGDTYFTAPITELILESYITRTRGTESLTAREREVLKLLAEGRSNKEVGSLLGISTRTVETHRSSIMTKLNAHSLGELVRYAIRHRLIQP